MDWWNPPEKTPAKEHRFGEAPGFQDLAPNGSDSRKFVPEPVMPVMPDLQKEKEKEKKGGAVPWRMGAPAARSVVIGARSVGGSSGFWGYFNGARLAGFLSEAFGPSTWLGGLFASGAGANLALAGMLAMGFAVGAAGFGAYTRWPQSTAAVKLPTLSAIESTIAVKRPVNQSLGYVAQANSGQIQFEPQVPANPQPPAQPKEERRSAKADSVPPPPDAQKLNLNREQFVQKMTNDPHQLHAGGLQDALNSFGNNFKKFDTGMSFNSTFGSLPKFNTGLSKLKAFNHQMTAFGSKKLTALAGKTNNALGQLGLSQKMSYNGAATQQANAARTYAADAFDQRSTQGGQAGGGASDTGSGIVTPLGGGAPDGGTGITNPGTPSAPSVGTPVNATPYQPQIDAAQNFGVSSGMMKMISIMLLAAAAVIMIIGKALSHNHTTLPIGLAMIAAAVAMMVMATKMNSMANNMANMGKSLGNQISTQYGQQGQGQTIDDCMAQAAANGTNPKDCKPRTPNPIPTNDPVQPAVSHEINRGTFSLGQ